MIRLLIVDKDKSCSTETMAALEGVSFKARFFFAYSFHGIEEILAKEDIDLVLFEPNLEGTSGYKAINSFIDRFSYLPVVVYTSTNNEIVASNAIKSGVQDYVVKSKDSSYDGKTLARAINYSLTRHKNAHKTALKKDEFEQLKTKYEEVQRLAKVGTWELDIVNNQMSWSPQFSAILNMDNRGAAPNLSEFLDMMAIDDRDKTEAFFDSALKGQNVPELEHRIILPAGKVITLSTNVTLNFHEESKKYSLFGSSQDITERKENLKMRVESQLSKQTSQTKEKMLTNLSFYVRTPLSSLANTVYLMEDVITNKNTADLVTMLRRSLEDLTINLNSLFNYSILDNTDVQLRPQEVHIQRFFETTVRSSLSTSGQEQIKDIKLSIHKKVPEYAILDADKLNQMLYNFFRAFSVQQQQEQLKLHVYTSKHNYSLASSNNRISIELSPVILSSGWFTILKDPYGWLNDNSEHIQQDSIDLSLAIAAILLKAMEGTIEEAKDDYGAPILRLTVPFEKAKGAIYNNNEKLNGSMDILLVEDHLLNQLTTKKLLKKWSLAINIDIANNGQEALDLLSNKRYDLILMDIQMPIMDGMTCTTEIRKNSDVPIVAITANATQEEKDRCLDIGMNDYLTKPYKPKELYGIISKNLEKAHS